MSGKEGDSYVKWFSESGKKDVGLAGCKGANLSELYRGKFPVAPGFIVTTKAYKAHLEKNGLQKNIMNLVNEINLNDFNSLERTCAKIRGLIEHAPLPKEIEESVKEAYDVLDVDKQKFDSASEGALDILLTSHEPPFVAVRTSPVIEKMNEDSLSGHHDSFLNVKGNDELMHFIKKAFSSVFTPRAVYNRRRKGLEHEKVLPGVVIQRMIDSDKSGVMFSKNPIEDDDSIVLEAVFGLGKGLVSGVISPDYYRLKNDLELMEQRISDKKIAFTRDSSGKTGSVNLKPEISKREVLNGHEIRMLGQYAKRLEEHYGVPQDIEFSIAGEDIFIMQSRPITSKAKKNESELAGNVVLSGKTVSQGIVSGNVKHIDNEEDFLNIKNNDIIIVDFLTEKATPYMHRARGVIVKEAGLGSHAMTLARELEIPVVSVKEGSEKLHTGQAVTLDGFTGRVIDGEAVEKKEEIKSALPTKTKIKVSIGLPDYAQKAAESGLRDIGLIGFEGIAANSGKHPEWYIKNEKLDDYTSSISESLNKTVKDFDSAWLRISDFRTDEHKSLEGHPHKKEGNPLLGNHGIRFALQNEDFLKAELQAVKEVSDHYDNKKFGVIIPQLISVPELRRVKKICEEISMPRNVKIGVMVETPASVQIINDICEEGVDFVNLGIVNLTQQTLCVDKGNEDLRGLYNEMHPAVLNSVNYVLRRCKRYGVETCFSGNLDKREMIDFLVEQGIDSICVPANMAYEISEHVQKLEGESSSSESKKSEEKEERRDFDENKKEEEIILKALEEENSEKQEEYNPGIGKSSGDVPDLNEAIPVDSSQFEDEKKEEVIVINNRAEPVENEENEDAKVYEKQADALFDSEVKEEAEEFEEAQKEQAEKKAQEEAAKQSEQQDQENVMDIF